MTKEELRSLTIEQLNGMTEEQLDVVANQVRNKLKISREGGLGSWKTWIALIISALVMSLMQLIMGK